MNRKSGIILLAALLPVLCLAVGYHPTTENFGTGAFTVEGAGGQLNVSATGTGLNALMAHTSGAQGSAIVAWAQSGAPAMLLLQDTHFDSPGLVVQRTGTTGDVATSPAVLIQGGPETTSTNMLIKAGGCLALSGDNWYVLWGDGAISSSGGLLDNTGTHRGKLSVDPVHRQLVAEDGITNVLTWTGSGVSIMGSHVLSAAFHAATDFDAVGVGATAAAAAQAASQPLNSKLTAITSWTQLPLVASASLDYPSIEANAEASLTIAVSGAVAAHYPTVTLGWSAALPDGVVVKQAFVSADNTVTIRVRNETGSAIDPSAVTCKVIVLDY